MRTICRLFTITLLAFVSAASFAQTYPAKAVRLIVPFPPGGSTDLVARVVGQKMADAWGKQVVIDNRPGANGMIGSDIVAKANPDGYSIVLGTIGPMAINASLYKMPYDILKDLAPISYTANIANACGKRRPRNDRNRQNPAGATDIRLQRHRWCTTHGR